MAATLTQERFSGPDWIFERKFDGIRLSRSSSGDDVRLYSRNRLPQNIPGVAAAIAALPRQDIILDGEITWDREQRVSRVRRAVARRPPSHGPAARGAARAAEAAAARPAAAPRPDDLTSRSRGTRACARRLGRGHREAPRLPLRAQAIEELAEDEVRADPRLHRRRLHRSRRDRASGSARCWLDTTTKDDFAFAGKIGTGFDTKLLVSLRHGSMRSRSTVRLSHESQAGCRGCAPTGCGRRSSSASASSSGPGMASCGIRGCWEWSRDHPSGEGHVPRRRDHQGGTGRVLRGGRAR